MGRELQKKKNKSSIPKAKQKPKSKRINVRSNPIVAANWDQSLTLSQNYRRLGLTSKLNTQAGGVERLESTPNNLTEPPRKLRNSLSVLSKLPTAITPTEARIERDPTTGAIVRVVHPSPRTQNSFHDTMNGSSKAAERNDMDVSESPGIVRALEEQASMETKQRPRQQSRREEEWLTKLVKKHGENYSRMVMDRKLNPYQQSEGDLRRRIKRWKDSGRRC